MMEIYGYNLGLNPISWDIAPVTVVRLNHFKSEGTVISYSSYFLYPYVQFFPIFHGERWSYQPHDSHYLPGLVNIQKAIENGH